MTIVQSPALRGRRTGEKKRGRRYRGDGRWPKMAAAHTDKKKKGQTNHKKKKTSGRGRNRMKSSPSGSMEMARVTPSIGSEIHRGRWWLSFSFYLISRADWSLHFMAAFISILIWFDRRLMCRLSMIVSLTHTLSGLWQIYLIFFYLIDVIYLFILNRNLNWKYHVTWIIENWR